MKLNWIETKSALSIENFQIFKINLYPYGRIFNYTFFSHNYFKYYTISKI